jgi:hypothetical protein
MKQISFNLSRLLAIVILLTGIVAQACSKKTDPSPGGEIQPVETETMKLIPDMFRVYLKLCLSLCVRQTSKLIDIANSEVKSFWEL